MYHTVAAEYENGHDPGTVLMDGIFQRLIELGMVIGQDTVSGDIDAYIHFLEKQENTDRLQERVAENLVLFAHYLENPAYRPPFQKLAGYLRDSGFMTLPIYRTTLRTAFESLESYAMREDRKISSFLMDLVLCSMNIRTEEYREIDRQAGLTEEEKEAIQEEEIQLLLRKYFSIRRLPGLLRDFEYLKAHYPYAYQSVQAIECELKDDPRRMSKDSLKQLMKKDGGTRSYYDHLYTELYESGTVIWNSDTGSLRHTGKKLGRNDPCPCGSGKKYKHCCGRTDNMKIQEFRELIKNADRSLLEKAFAECYKQFSKSKKEEIDLLVQNILSGADSVKEKKSAVNFEELEKQIQWFAANAYEQNYVVPNRIIPKNQRSKWRFQVMNFIKQLQKIPPDSEYSQRAADCLEKIYKVLAEGCNVYLFSSDDPFSSVQWKQDELFHLLVTMAFRTGYSREKIRRLLPLTSSGGLSRWNLYICNQAAFLSELKTSDLKYMAIEETKKIIAETKTQITGKGSYRSGDFERTEKINHLCDMILLISISLGEAEQEIRYYFSNSMESDREIILYRALECADWMEDDRVWIDIYRFGLTKKIKPRDSLKKKYGELTASIKN